MSMFPVKAGNTSTRAIPVDDLGVSCRRANCSPESKALRIRYLLEISDEMHRVPLALTCQRYCE